MKHSEYAVAFLETVSSTVPQSRAPIERMVRVYAALKEKRSVNCNTLARDLEVSVRSVSRDLDFMRDRLHLPIEYVPEQHTYRLGGLR